MTQPKEPPVSLRLPKALRAQVEEYARAHGIARNAAYAALIERGLGGFEQGKNIARLSADFQAAHAPMTPAVRVDVPVATNAPAPFGSRLKKR